MPEKNRLTDRGHLDTNRKKKRPKRDTGPTITAMLQTFVAGQNYPFHVDGANLDLVQDITFAATIGNLTNEWTITDFTLTGTTALDFSTVMPDFGVGGDGGVTITLNPVVGAPPPPPITILAFFVSVPVTGLDRPTLPAVNARGVAKLVY